MQDYRDLEKISRVLLRQQKILLVLLLDRYCTLKEAKSRKMYTILTADSFHVHVKGKGIYCIRHYKRG
jgi:hypothetical protein